MDTLSKFKLRTREKSVTVLGALIHNIHHRTLVSGHGVDIRSDRYGSTDAWRPYRGNVYPLIILGNVYQSLGPFKW